MLQGEKDELLGTDEECTEQECHPKKERFILPNPFEIERIDDDKRPWEPHDRSIIRERSIFQEYDRGHKCQY